MMNATEFLQEAKALESELLADRRYLHQHPGTGFDTQAALSYVRQELTAMGYEPKDCGQAGIVALAGGKQPGKVFLLRADMDALPMQEASGVPFPSQNEGVMHACGHDMHTAMLLSAARLLKAHEDEICGTVKLMFQSAEEIFEGSHDMIRAGVLKSPDVDAALMIHVMAGMPMPAGSVIVCDGGISAPGADYFTIQIQGKGCHGSMPNAGIDPINVAAHIITALQELHSRELALTEDAVLTIGTIHGGSAANVIPDRVELGGTIRTYDEGVRTMLKTRMTEIAQGIATTFRASATVSFGSGCPCLKNDPDLSQCTVTYAQELLGPKAFSVSQLAAMSGDHTSSKSAGSEDFAYVSQEVPSIMLALAAGNPSEGYCYPQHHPKVTFDEAALTDGCAIYAYAALRWLEEHR
jgi:hippurate hydrolase